MEKLTHEQFVVKAIESLRQGKYRGIHTVYSGFNEAFKQYFTEDPVKATGLLAKEGKIVIIPCKGGVMIYKAGEAPTFENQALAKMGLA